jgi:GT2 family glycosyltransferase
VVEDHVRSSYAARNKGVEAAEGEIISFIDADMTVSPDWLARVQRAFDSPDVEYLGTRIRVYSAKKTVYALYNVVAGFPVQLYMAKLHYAPTACLSVRQEVFDRLGLFDDRLKSGGDGEFGKRAWAAGVGFRYASGIVMLHPARDSLRALLKKAYRIGKHGRGEVSCLYSNRKDLNRIYLSSRNYLPSIPWKIRKRYRCGYSFKMGTVAAFVLLPLLMHYVSAVGFLQTKVRYLFKAGRPAKRSHRVTRS